MLGELGEFQGYEVGCRFVRNNGTDRARDRAKVCAFIRGVFDVEFDYSSRATRYSTWYIPRDGTMFGSGNQFSLEKFSSIFPTYVPGGRGIKMSLDDLRLRNRSINRFRFQFIALDTVRSLSFLWCEQLLVLIPEFPFRNTLSPFNTRRNCDAPTLATALNFPFVLNVARFTRSFSFIRASYRKERIIVFIWFRAWRNSRDQEYE